MRRTSRVRFGALFAACLCAVPAASIAKGRARSFRLEGVIQLPAPSERPDQFLVTGDLIALDCRQDCETATWQKAGRMDVRIRFRAGQFFRVWAPNRRAAAVREPESMFAVIQDAAAHRHRVRLDLVDPILQFGTLGDVKGLEAELDGITDFHLQ
jgi:hypothetical protein